MTSQRVITSFVCRPTRPPRRSFSAHQRSPFNGHLFSSFDLLFASLDQNPFTRCRHAVSFSLASLNASTFSHSSPRSVFQPLPHVPHLTFISSFPPAVLFPAQRRPLLPLLTCVRPLLPHFSHFYLIPISRSTLPPGWLFSLSSPYLLRFPSFRLLFIPSFCVSHLLFVLASL